MAYSTMKEGIGAKKEEEEILELTDLIEAGPGYEAVGAKLKFGSVSPKGAVSEEKALELEGPGPITLEMPPIGLGVTRPQEAQGSAGLVSGALSQDDLKHLEEMLKELVKNTVEKTAREAFLEVAERLIKEAILELRKALDRQ